MATANSNLSLADFNTSSHTIKKIFDSLKAIINKKDNFLAGLVDFIESMYVVRFSVVNMSDGTNVYPLCQKSVGSKDKVVILEKGLKELTKQASIEGQKSKCSPGLLYTYLAVRYLSTKKTLNTKRHR